LRKKHDFILKYVFTVAQKIPWLPQDAENAVGVLCGSKTELWELKRALSLITK